MVRERERFNISTARVQAYGGCFKGNLFLFATHLSRYMHFKVGFRYTPPAKIHVTHLVTIPSFPWTTEYIRQAKPQPQKKGFPFSCFVLWWFRYGPFSRAPPRIGKLLYIWSNSIFQFFPQAFWNSEGVRIPRIQTDERVQRITRPCPRAKGGLSARERLGRYLKEKIILCTYSGPIVTEIALNPPGYLDLDVVFLHKVVVFATSCNAHHRPAQTSVGCHLPQSVPKTTGRWSCLRARMMQIQELKKDSGTARAEMYFERHERMVLINKLALALTERVCDLLLRDVLKYSVLFLKESADRR